MSWTISSKTHVAFNTGKAIMRAEGGDRVIDITLPGSSVGDEQDDNAGRRVPGNVTDIPPTGGMQGQCNLSYGPLIIQKKLGPHK